MKRNLVGSIYGRFCIRFPQNGMTGERHSSAQFYKATIFLYLMKTCNWFNKWYLWNINPVFINGTLQKWHNSLIILSYLAVFTIIEFLLSGQKFILTLLSDNLTILGIIWACKVFLDCFYDYLKKQPSSQVEKIYAKTSFNIPLI